MKKERMKVIVLSIVLFITTTQAQVRVKDVAKIQGLHDTQLAGYGLVVGLEGTGDGTRAMFTVQSVLNMLKNLGIEVPTTRIRIKNVAAVMVTSNLRPFVKKGARIDVTVSSLGDAKSLEGGTLLMTPLQDVQGQIYALAQGALSTGGYRIEEERYSLRAKNHVAVGIIPDGAIIQKEVSTNELSREKIWLELSNPDFTTAVSLAKTINNKMGADLAQTEDAATVSVATPLASIEGGKFFEFIADIEQVSFMNDRMARVVLNEKTGTIVAGGEVTISQVAVSHGGISIEVKNTPLVSQPAPLSQGQTTMVPVLQQEVVEEKPQMVVLGPSNVTQLANTLNELGIAPRDIIAIFQAIKKAGALNADLLVM
jgi:flagellar P-ring protein precursor FlgI